MRFHDIANLPGTPIVWFELTTDLVFGGTARAKLRAIDAELETMETTDQEIRVKDFIGTIRGVTGNYGCGVFVPSDKPYSTTAADDPLVAIIQLQCS